MHLIGYSTVDYKTMNSLRNRDSSRLSRSRSFKASPSTLSTEALDDDTCAFSVATNPNSISLSIQESEESFTSEDTEDTYAFVNVMESIKAEITGDYSHFECERHYHSDVDDESFSLSTVRRVLWIRFVSS